MLEPAELDEKYESFLIPPITPNILHPTFLGDHPGTVT